MVWTALTTGGHGGWGRALTLHFIREEAGLCSKLPKPYRDVLSLARCTSLKVSSPPKTVPPTGDQVFKSVNVRVESAHFFLILTTVSVYTMYCSIGKEGRAASLGV